MKNIKFIKTNDDETCEIDKQDESLVKTCQLLKVDAKQMNESLCQMMINNEKFKLNIQKSSDRRNNLAKQLYKELFKWIINKINKCIDFRNNNEFDTNYLNINILDIYGFENVENNSFEQFCINYCNETLQQNFCQVYTHKLIIYLSRLYLKLNI